MADFDIGPIGSQVYGIAGMGIGLGLLMGTARMVQDNFSSYHAQQRQRASYYNQPHIRPPKMTRDRHQSSFYFEPGRY